MDMEGDGYDTSESDMNLLLNLSDLMNSRFLRRTNLESLELMLMLPQAPEYDGIMRYPSTRAPEHHPRMRYQNGVWEYFDEDGVVIRVEYEDAYPNVRFGAVPASEKAIARLPVATASETREEECSVCLESFEEDDKLSKMTCLSSHGFHESCILKWLRVSRLCPLCRFALPADNDEDEEEDTGSNEDTEGEQEETEAGTMVESIEADETDIEGDVGTGTNDHEQTLEEANTGSGIETESSESTEPAEEFNLARANMLSS